MSNAQHTPGPWSVTESSDWSGMGGVSLGIDDAYGMDGGRDYHLATVVHGDPDELKANACLISAAPELLEVAEGILVDDMLQYLPDEYIAKVRAAIAKAKGE